MDEHRLRELAELRRARDLIDRLFAGPLDVAAMAAGAHMSPAHFSRRFRDAFGETPYSYLMTRRIERAMQLLRSGETVTDACMRVGCTSLGSFSASFKRITGETPTQYRQRDHSNLEALPACIARISARPNAVVADEPSRIREADGNGSA